MDIDPDKMRYNLNWGDGYVTQFTGNLLEYTCSKGAESNTDVPGSDTQTLKTSFRFKLLAKLIFPSNSPLLSRDSITVTMAYARKGRVESTASIGWSEPQWGYGPPTAWKTDSTGSQGVAKSQIAKSY